MEEEKNGSVTMNVNAEKQLEITRIGETPFQYATNGEKNYITCGRVILETEKTLEETKQWINCEIPWEAIALICQALTNEMLTENNK